ncbi:MAG TPA: hypothetical protein VFX46_00435 [Hyphomicrobiaceae bacterium]|nr:hypothetical protein [Hyphomicrobiaceae bacterium]
MSCLLLVPLIACGDDDDGTGPTPTPVATTVTIDPGTATLTAIGDTIRLAARVRDQNGATMAGATVTWSSLDPDVAPVAGAGSTRGIETRANCNPVYLFVECSLSGSNDAENNLRSTRESRAITI